MNCNTEQKEIGGKDLLLKACVEKNAATTDLSSNVTITAHGAKVGDIVVFRNVDQLTTFALNIFYYVKEIVDANTVKLSLNKSSAAIVADETEAALVVDLFTSVGGVRTKSKAFSSEAIDITNEDSDQWKKTLDGAGIRSLAFSVDGVVTNNSVYDATVDKIQNNLLLCLLFVNTKTGKLVEGCFKGTSHEESAPYDGEATFSASFESAGVPTFFSMGI